LQANDEFVDIEDLKQKQINKILQLLLDRLNLRVMIRRDQTAGDEVWLYDLSSLDD